MVAGNPSGPPGAMPAPARSCRASPTQALWNTVRSHAKGTGRPGSYSGAGNTRRRSACSRQRHLATQDPDDVTDGPALQAWYVTHVKRCPYSYFPRAER